MAVVDNGCGIANSLIARGEQVDVVKYLSGLVDNRHALREMGRGDGIAKIARRTQDCGGTFLIASGPIPATGHSVVVDYDHPAGHRKNQSPRMTSGFREPLPWFEFHSTLRATDSDP